MLVVATLYFGRPILVPVVSAILLTFLLSPPVKWLERRHIPRLAAVFTVVLLLFSIFGLIAWYATIQISALIVDLPKYQQNLHTKILDLRGSESSGLRKLGDSIGQLTSEITQSMDDSEKAKQIVDKSIAPAQPPMPVKVIADPTTPLAAAELAIGSLAGPLASVGVVTVLVIFMLLVREDLRDRLVRLAGTNQVTLTTRTFDELGTRISRYLLLNALVNGTFGLTIGFGLFAIGVQYAPVWGMLAAILRFIPYIGALIASVAPIAVAVAQFPTWTQPAIVIGLFVVMGVLCDNIIEPLVYGRGAGVSPVALLMAAMFWSWIWGPVGLILSVPLTVSLAVLGKYLPPLEPLWVLLGNEASLPISVRYYQRLLADDVDEAIEILDEYRKDHSLPNTFDQVLLPALAQAERDREHGDISAANQERIWRTTEQLLDDLSVVPIPETQPVPETTAKVLQVLGVPAQDQGDEFALKMLALAAESKFQIETIATATLAGELLKRLEVDEPDVVCISSLGPGGVSAVRYICKRIRQKFPHLPIVVGRWAFQGNTEKMIANTKERGATYVVTDLSTAITALEKIPTNTHSKTPIPSDA